jgi:hypothetical protein
MPLVKENWMGLKLNRTDQLLVYDEDVSLLEDKIHTRKETEEL